MAKPLTVKTVEALTGTTSKGMDLAKEPKPGRHTDGDGLHLHVRSDGRAGWVLRYRLHGRQRDMSLGGWPDVGLKEARTLAAAARQQITAGTDPCPSSNDLRQIGALSNGVSGPSGIEVKLRFGDASSGVGGWFCA